MKELVRQGYRKARAVTRQHARSFHVASLLLFGARRRAAFALYAFCRRLDDLVDREDRDGALAERLSRARALIASLYREAPHLADPSRGPVEARAASVAQDRASNAPDRRLGPVEARAASVAQDRTSKVPDRRLGPVEACAGNVAQEHASDVADPSRGPMATPAASVLPDDLWDVAELAALRDTIDRFGVPEQPFQDLVSGMEMDVAGHRYATFADLELYCDRVAGTVGLLLCPVLGTSDPRAPAAAADLGRAMQLTNILRDVREDLARGRVYLPEDELAAFGLSREDLLRGTVDERWRAFMASQIARARVYYARAARGVPWLTGPGTQRMVKLMGALYGGILGDIEARGYDVFSLRAHVPTATKLRTVLATLLRPRTVLPPPEEVPTPLFPRGAS
ncbi:MAG TPA: squalene/phytoene synthase family protein [Myxococcaceae bacterium]|nr:squalene/phytoene synthase family protein [Myxococcaceae bacterium]